MIHNTLVEVVQHIFSLQGKVLKNIRKLNVLEISVCVSSCIHEVWYSKTFRAVMIWSWNWAYPLPLSELWHLGLDQPLWMHIYAMPSSLLMMWNLEQKAPSQLLDNRCYVLVLISLLHKNFLYPADCNTFPNFYPNSFQDCALLLFTGELLSKNISKYSAWLIKGEWMHGFFNAAINHILRRTAYAKTEKM